MIRVRMFCDWDNNSTELIERLAKQTDGFKGRDYKNVHFVDDDTYTHAICFNFPTYDLLSPSSNNFALLLEPPELVASMFRIQKGQKYPNVNSIYSFAADVYEPAFGIGFATSEDIEYPSILDKPNQICMIVSDKLMTPFHRKRQQIKDALLQTDLPIDFYGRNMSTSDDDPRIKGEIPPMRKFEVLSQYKLCIDLENSPHCVVTDKFFDPVLCNTMPVSNAAILSSFIDTDAYFFINFDLPIKDLLDDFEDICEFEVTADNERALLAAKREVRSGSMCLAEWIYQRVRGTL
jgi:hypothetical protein